jgi:hypothetical protein
MPTTNAYLESSDRLLVCHFSRRKDLAKRVIESLPDGYHESKPARKSNGMPIIKCKCGELILVLPDVKAMNKAIENHLATHKYAVDYLREYLIKQLFEVVAEKSEIKETT